MPLVQRDAALAVIPATLDEETLAKRLAEAECAAVIKLGRHFEKLRRVADRLGLLDGAVYIEHASLPDQRVMPLAEVDPAGHAGGVPYFAMALLRRHAPR
jgi:precorrin-2 methylase